MQTVFVFFVRVKNGLGESLGDSIQCGSKGVGEVTWTNK